MTKQQKIDAIYEKIANKELSFGCRIKISGEVYTLIEYDGGIYPYSNYIYYNLQGNKILNEGYYDEIIGHPVMIGDVMDYDKIFCSISEEYSDTNNGFIHYADRGFYKFMKLWKEKRKPIEDQSEQCIDLVYNLIS